MAPPVKVHVVYCGGWGYRPRAEKVWKVLLDHFNANDIEFTMEATRGITGHLEVTVNDKLVHSKKNGDGYIDSDAKYQKIIDAVAAALKQ